MFWARVGPNPYSARLNPDPVNTKPPILERGLRFADAGSGHHLIPNARLTEFEQNIVE